MNDFQTVYIIVNSKTGKVLKRDKVCAYVSLEHAERGRDKWLESANAIIVEYIPNEKQNLEQN
jgi:hypothetical protein